MWPKPIAYRYKKRQKFHKLILVITILFLNLVQNSLPLEFYYFFESDFSDLSHGTLPKIFQLKFEENKTKIKNTHPHISYLQ